MSSRGQSLSAPLAKDEFFRVVNQAHENNGLPSRQLNEIETDYNFYLRLHKVYGGEGKLSFEYRMGRVNLSYGD
ncbi:hypothetical protein [Pseudogemmobacter sonorensis]|uniref:hypothetical protein n=1 Tax=Pseudogemmobacter sonorensis TaxID=2989681 RepID=UPI0036BE90EF